MNEKLITFLTCLPCFAEENTCTEAHTFNVRSKKFFSVQTAEQWKPSRFSSSSENRHSKTIRNNYRLFLWWVRFRCRSRFFRNNPWLQELTWWSRAKIFWAQTESGEFQLYQFDWDGRERSKRDRERESEREFGKKLPQHHWKTILLSNSSIFLPLLTTVCHIFSAQFWLNLMSSSLYWRFALLWWQRQHTSIRHTDNSELPNSMNCTEKRNEFNVCNGNERTLPLPSLERAWSKPFYELILFSICFSFNFNRISFSFLFLLHSPWHEVRFTCRAALGKLSDKTFAVLWKLFCRQCLGATILLGMKFSVFCSHNARGWWREGSLVLLSFALLCDWLHFQFSHRTKVLVNQSDDDGGNGDSKQATNQQPNK